MKSPKGHPELAGCGIEYCFGMSKRLFRKLVSERTKQNFQENISYCISAESLPIESKMRFERKTRDYLNAYRKLSKDQSLNASDVSFSTIENMMKSRKTQRNIFDIERTYLNREINRNYEDL